MDKIWDRDPLSRRSLAVVAGMKNTEWPRRTNKSQTLIYFIKNKDYIIIYI